MHYVFRVPSKPLITKMEGLNSSVSLCRLQLRSSGSSTTELRVVSVTHCSCHCVLAPLALLLKPWLRRETSITFILRRLLGRLVWVSLSCLG